MKNIQKVISLVLALTMILAMFSFAVGAEENTKNTYVPDYDTETPVVLIHGIGQNNTYVVDDEGNRLTDSDGKTITGWPLSVDIGAMLKQVLVPLLKSVITRTDAGLSEGMEQGAYDLLYAVHKDSNGVYENNIEVPCYECSMADMPEDIRSTYYRRLPVQGCGEIIGEDNLYFFGYDSLGDITATTEKLHDFITNVVLPQTGAKQVNLCPVSLGGTVALSYMDMYKEDYNLIKKIVYIVPALDGSDIVGDLLTDNLSTYDNDALYGDVLVGLMGDNFTTYLVSMLLHILPSSVLKSAISGLGRGAVKALVQNTTQLWALCPTKYYEEARALWIADEEHEALAARVDAFMQARANFEDNLNTFMAQGGKVYDINCYGCTLFPLTKDYKTTNSDMIIQSESTSMGATFADLGSTLGENYKAVGTYCNNENHNHISPDNVVDATTGLLPDRTWYFKGQDHEQLANNDVAIELAIELMLDDNFEDVYSNPEAYPQFNGVRNTKNVKKQIDMFRNADKSDIPQEKIDKIEIAISAVEKEMDETVIDEAKWAEVENDLNLALADAGLVEIKKTSTFETIFTKLAKIASQAIKNID